MAPPPRDPRRPPREDTGNSDAGDDSAKALAERERKNTSFVRPGDRGRGPARGPAGHERADTSFVRRGEREISALSYQRPSEPTRTTPGPAVPAGPASAGQTQGATDTQARMRASARAIAERERAETSFIGPGQREVTISQPHVAKPKAAPVGPPARPAPAAAGRPGQSAVPAAAQGATATQPKQLTAHQQRMLSSAFQDSARIERLKSVVGTSGERPRDDDDEDDDEATALGRTFDGKTPAKELTHRDLFKAVQAPVQSREGRRAKSLYEQVIFQFAVGNNPRYAPDGPNRPRGHIFVWDVSRAMNCEVPHFFGIKELSLGQTVDWIRHEGPPRGWTRAKEADALSAVAKGLLVLAMPKEVRLKQLAVVLPSVPGPDGRPRVAAAAVVLGADLSVVEALGVPQADYYFHT